VHDMAHAEPVHLTPPGAWDPDPGNLGYGAGRGVVMRVE
jgi:hypothetical protein